MNHLVRRYASILVLLAFVGIFSWYFLSNRQDFDILFDINPIFVALSAAGHIAVIGLNAVFIRHVLRPFDKNITHYDSFFVSLISSIGNFFLPLQSGAGVRAVYLKKKYDLAYDNFLSIISGTYAINFLLNSAIGLLALFFLRHQTSNHELILIGLVFGGIFLACALVVFTRASEVVVSIGLRLLPYKRLANVARRVQDGWDGIVTDKRLLGDLVLITVGIIAVNYVLFQAELSSLGLTTSFWSILFYSSLGAIVLILNITPASLGIRETVLIFAASALGLTVPQILSLAIIDRGVKFFVLAASWLILHTRANFSFKKYSGSVNES